MCLKSMAVGFVLCLSQFAAGFGFAAEPLPVPNGTVVLSVSGRISAHNADRAADFDMATLQSLGGDVLATSTPWTEGVVTFEGISMATLLERLGAEGVELHATALNDYAVTVPLDELRTYPVLLAYKMNGKPMSVRDKGPLWLIYPRDQYERFQSEEHNFKWIWQIRRFEVK